MFYGPGKHLGKFVEASDSVPAFLGKRIGGILIVRRLPSKLELGFHEKPASYQFGKIMLEVLPIDVGAVIEMCDFDVLTHPFAVQSNLQDGDLDFEPRTLHISFRTFGPSTSVLLS